jgi:hypothetical protein
MSHEDLVLATLYTKSGPVSVEQEISKDVDRLMAARCSDKDMTTKDPRECGRLAEVAFSHFDKHGCWLGAKRSEQWPVK